MIWFVALRTTESSSYNSFMSSPQPELAWMRSDLSLKDRLGQHLAAVRIIMHKDLGNICVD